MVMAIRQIAICLAILFIIPLLALADVRISVEIDEDLSGVNRPLEVIVKVQRDEGMQIDESSFLMGDDPLQVESLGETHHISQSIINGKHSQQNLVITNYRFEIEGKPKGVYLLPPISVHIDGKTYHSPSINYVVQETQSNESFQLDASIEGKMPLYPGQRATLVYRIGFTENIELTAQNLPLLEAEGFRRIGEQQYKNYSQNGLYVQEVAQEVEAIIPGTYTFGPSMVEGFHYKADWFGRRTYVKPRLQANADAISIIVNPFPAKGKPQSFNGALGNFSMHVNMLTHQKVSVGDKVQLEIEITGSGAFSTIQSPDLAHQPGFAGNFRLSDLPPTGEEHQNAKRFLVELRPLSENIQEIPPISFAFFDPDTEQYDEIQSFSIPLEVTPLQKISSEESPTHTQEQPAEKVVWEEQQGPGLIEIQGNYPLQVSDLRPNRLFTWDVLYIIPLGALFMMLQIILHHYLTEKKGKQPRKTAGDLFREALRQKKEPKQFFALLEAALLLRLKEKRYIGRGVRSAANLKQEGLVGEIRTFLLDIEEKRFAGSEEISISEIVKEATLLYNRIRQ